MRLNFYIIAVSTLVFATGPLLAEPGVVVSLASVGDRVRAQNPYLAAARWKIREAEGHLRQAGRLPNPELETEIEHSLDFEDRRLEVGLNQRFPVTNRLSLEKDLGGIEVSAAKIEVREEENRLRGEARAAVIEVLAIRQRKVLLGDQIALSRELADFITESAKRGEGSLLDAGQAKLEAARLSAEQRQIDAQVARVIGGLKPLLGMKSGETLHVSGSLPKVGEFRAQVGGRPALELGKMAVTAAEKEAAIERTRQFGDVEAGLFAAAERFVDSPEAADKQGIVGFRFKVPLPFWDKNEGNIDAAVAKTERRKKEAEALAAGIRLEADAAKAEMVEWAELVGVIENDLLPLADEQATLSESAWREGQTELRDVLRAREKRLELAAAQLDARRDYNLARVRYETALGNF